MEEKKTKLKKKKKFLLFKIFLIISLIASIAFLEGAFRQGNQSLMDYFYIPLIFFKLITLFSLFKAKEELARKISISFLIFCIAIGGLGLFIERPIPCEDYFDASLCKIILKENCITSFPRGIDYPGEKTCYKLFDSYERIDEEPRSFSGDFLGSLASSFSVLDPIYASSSIGNFFGLLTGFGVWIFYLSKEKPKKQKELFL